MNGNGQARNGVRPAAAALLAATLAACGEEAEVAPAGLARLPNPASAHCIELGGTLDIVDEPAGQVGYCRLPDGRRVEEWALFRAAREAGAPGGETGK